MNDERQAQRVHLLHDPGPTDEPPDDAFGVEDVARRLTDLIAEAGPPFTISLSGAWGIGKTTLAESVRRRSSILVASLDLWSQDASQLRRSIVIEIGTLLRGGGDDAKETVAQELDDELRVSRTDVVPGGPRLRFREALRRIRAAPELGVWSLTATLGWIVGFLVVTTLMPGLGGQILGQLLTALAIFVLIQSGLVITIATTTESRAPAEAEVATLRKYAEFAAVTEQDDRPVLLILDNLDRLTGEEALVALGEIRALVDLPNSRCIFMIPVDRHALARHLAAEVGGGDQLAARDFLDKLFNVDVLLTKPQSLDLRTWTRAQALELLPDAAASDLSALAQVVASAADGSPRVVKRILNGIGARYALLSDEVREISTLSQLALVEAVASRFPLLVDRLSGNPDAFVRMRTRLRDASNSGVRTGVVDIYLASMKVAEALGDASEAFRDFLLKNDSVELTAESLQTILALREDRRWRGVPTAIALKRSLETGEADAFLQAYSTLDESEAERAREAVLDDIRASVENGFLEDGISALNASVTAIGPTDHRNDLQELGQELLLGADPAILSDAAVDMTYDGTLTTRSGAIVARAVEILDQENSGEASTASLRAVGNSVGLLTEGQRTTVRKGLAEVPDDLLEPFFTKGPHVDLVRGAVAAIYLQRLANWDPAEADPTRTLVAADRLAWLGNAGPFVASAYEPVAARLVAVLPSTTADHEQTLDRIVQVLRNMREPSTSLDNVAQLLSAWSPNVAAGLRMAWRVDASEAAVASVRTRTESWLGAADLISTRTFFSEHRSKLLASGTPVGTSLTRRWITGEADDFAQVVLDGGESSWVGEFVAQVDSIADPATFGSYASTAAELLAGRKLTDGLLALSSSVARQMSVMPATALASAARAIESIAKVGGPIEEPLRALDERIAAASAADIDRVADSVAVLAEENVSGSESLPGKVIGRSAALGRLPLPTAVELGRHKSTTPGDLRIAVAAAIRDPANTPSTIQPILESLRGKLRGDWRITAAVVARAAGNPSEAPELLPMLEDWKPPPPSALERADFDAQLGQLAESDPSSDELIKHLRN